MAFLPAPALGGAVCTATGVLCEKPQQSCARGRRHSAKKLLAARVVLEVRRPLAHTTLPVAVIGDQLGFDEATNFVKFIRRETGSTHGAFRTQRKAA